MSAEDKKSEILDELLDLLYRHRRKVLVSIVTVLAPTVPALAWFVFSFVNDFSNIKSQVNALTTTNRGPPGERGLAGPPGERGPPGSSADAAALVAQVDRLNRKVETLQAAIKDASKPSGPVSLPPQQNTSLTAANEPLGEALNGCRTLTDAARVSVRVNDVLCSRDGSSFAKIDQINTRRIYYVVNGKGVSCGVGDNCSFDWPGRQPRFRIVFADADGSAELNFEQ